MGEKTIIFWWPHSIFTDVYWKKDQGSIPIELNQLGYDFILIVSKLKFNPNIGIDFSTEYALIHSLR